MILEKCSGKKKGRGKPVKFKTPYYMIHEQELDENFKKLKDALENWSIGLDCRILLKTVRSVVKSEGSV